MSERLKPINFTLYEIRTCGLIHVCKICFSSGFVLLPLLLGAGMCRHSSRRRNRESIGEYLYRLVGLVNNIRQSIAHLSRGGLDFLFLGREYLYRLVGLANNIKQSIALLSLVENFGWFTIFRERIEEPCSVMSDPGDVQEVDAVSDLSWTIKNLYNLHL